MEGVELLPDEDLTRLGDGGRVVIIQKKGGYRFGIDTILLLHFSGPYRAVRIADLGTGSGVIPILAVREGRDAKAVGIEIQEDLFHMARRNVSLNGLEERVEIVMGDAARVSEGDRHPFNLVKGRFDLVMANPPFRERGRGRASPRPERESARCERGGGVKDFVMGAARLLKKGGRFTVIFPPARLQHLLTLMEGSGIYLSKMRPVLSRPGDIPHLVLIEGLSGKGQGTRLLPPLSIYSSPEGGEYSKEVSEMLRRWGIAAPSSSPPF